MKIFRRIAFIGLFITSFTYSTAQTNTETLDLSKFRFSYDQMKEIANSEQLRHRIFYLKPSQGSDAEWFDAIKRGDTEFVKQMVQNGQDIEARDDASLGQTALGWAAFIGYEDIVDYLLSVGANYRATDRAGCYNTLKSAVLGNNVNIVKKLYTLLKDETNINAQESDGETLTIVAASNGRYEILKFLLTLKPDLNIVSADHDASALSIACDKGYQNIVDLLIQNGAINHKTGKSDCDYSN